MESIMQMRISNEGGLILFLIAFRVQSIRIMKLANSWRMKNSGRSRENRIQIGYKYFLEDSSILFVAIIIIVVILFRNKSTI